MTRLISFFVIATLGAGCNPGSRDSTPPLPPDVSYEIVEAQRTPDIKCSLDIRLNRRVSEDVLRALAMTLKQEQPGNYKRVFIGYYLPHMKIGAGGWATTHFDPDLKISILGLTEETARTLTAEPADPSRQVIGRWLDDVRVCRVTLYREGGKVIMERKFSDGSAGNQEMIEKQGRFEKKGGSQSGDHYLIAPDGNLQSRDKDGLIATSQAIK